ncbi:hypothetical protein ANCCAN_02981 [Ancylostoma caninum]|uniref:Uncharacterized protein n=1 Tax=Ancylostoma caninum TaxID=29170 RepID=A0A368H5E6_ANCCA|nr:hypothetical protein ANCCAN_02981 [Ancylostoma caninum]
MNELLKIGRKIPIGREVEIRGKVEDKINLDQGRKIPIGREVEIRGKVEDKINSDQVRKIPIGREVEIRGKVGDKTSLDQVAHHDGNISLALAQPYSVEMRILAQLLTNLVSNLLRGKLDLEETPGVDKVDHGRISVAVAVHPGIKAGTTPTGGGDTGTGTPTAGTSGTEIIEI